MSSHPDRLSMMWRIDQRQILPFSFDHRDALMYDRVNANKINFHQFAIVHLRQFCPFVISWEIGLLPWTTVAQHCDDCFHFVIDNLQFRILFSLFLRPPQSRSKSMRCNHSTSRTRVSNCRRKMQCNKLNFSPGTKFILTESIISIQSFSLCV